MEQELEVDEQDMREREDDQPWLEDAVGREKNQDPPFLSLYTHPWDGTELIPIPRQYIQSSYPAIKKSQPDLKFMIREAAGVEPRAFVRFGTFSFYVSLFLLVLVSCVTIAYAGQSLSIFAGGSWNLDEGFLFGPGPRRSLPLLTVISAVLGDGLGQRCCRF
jgi:hypothetical protein